MLTFVILFVAIDCSLDNKISYAIFKSNKKETTEFFTRPKFFGEKDYLLIQGLPISTPLFIAPIPINTAVNIFDIVGLDKYRCIVDNIFGLSICGQKVDISNFCTIGATRTIVFFIGENNKFSLGINFDSGETIIRTDSKEFESEIATLVFGAKNLKTHNPKQSKSKLEESKNNKIGDNDV
jgi:hypothetical protein